MDTKVLGSEGIALGAKLIKNGEVVAFPTETVYGLGGDAFNEEAIKKIYLAKGRPSDNPLIVHISELDDVYKVAKEVPDAYFRLAEKFLPGPLTVILPKRDEVPYACTGGLDTVAVRFPSHPMAREFIKATGTLIAAPSANVSTHVSPTTAKHVYDDLNGRIPLILDGGECEGGIESTILTLTRDIPTVLRPGIITEMDLLSVLSEVEMFKGKVERAEAPGMKYKHYAPRTRAVLASNPEKAVELYDNAAKQGLRPEILALSEHTAIYGNRKLIDLGGDEYAVARRIYNALHVAENESDLIIIDNLTGGGVYDSVMNRVMKAVAGRVE